MKPHVVFPPAHRPCRIERIVALSVAMILSGCFDPLYTARQENTARAYREFIRENPDHELAGEAKRLEAEAALRELGDNPKEHQLKYYLKRYPDSPLVEQVRTQMMEQKLRHYLAEWHLKGLKRLADDCRGLAIEDRVKAASWYMTGSKEALRKLKADFFERYLQEYQGGDHTEHARAVLAWMKSLRVKRQRTIPVVLEGYFSRDALKHIKDLFRDVQARPKFRQEIGTLREYDGKVLYRMTKLLPGNKKQFYNDRGELIEFTAARSGEIVEILTVDEGKVIPLWIWGTLKAAGLQAMYFPVISWNTRKAMMAEKKTGSTIGEIANFGRYLLVSTVDGFELFDPTFPDKLRQIYQYTRPTGMRGTARHLRHKVAVSGGLIALYGEGVELLDCHSLPRIVGNASATYDRVGQVTSGTFVGETFFFTTESGNLHAVSMDAKQPEIVGMSEYSFVTSTGRQLVVGADDGLAFYQIRKGGQLGKRSHISYLDFPDGFTSDSKIVDAFPMRIGLVLINDEGESALFRGGRLRTDWINKESLGTVYKLSANGTWLASISEGGISLQLRSRYRGRWKNIGAIPIHGCQGVNLRYPMAYLVCGDRIKTVHMGAFSTQP